MSSKYLQTTSGSISWTAGANFSPTTAPTTSDDVFVLNSAATIDSGLLNTATLASLTIPATFTGSAGLTAQLTKSVSGITRSSTTATATSTAHGYSNGDSITVSGATHSDYNGTFTISNVSADTFDYTVANSPTSPDGGSVTICVKNDYLIQPVTAFVFGEGAGNSQFANGCGRWKHNFGTVQATVTILGTAQPTETGYEAVRLLGSNASNTLYMIGGICGLATSYPTETCTFATINQTGGTLNVGQGTSWTTVYQSGGTMTLSAGSTSGTFTQSDGSCWMRGTGKVATVTVGKSLKFDMRAASGTSIGTLNLNDGATLDLTGNPAAISVDTIVVDGAATILRNAANPGHLSWTTLTPIAGSSLTLK